jgi:F420H(2)-dependent quinone reductase
MNTVQVTSPRRVSRFWWVRRVFNPLATRILRSPLHGLMSRRLMLISFRGKKSGRYFTTPISYVQNGESLLLGVGGPWWRNFAGGVPVQVRLRGRTRDGRAEATTDEARVTEAYRTILRRNRTRARFMGIAATSDGQPDKHSIEDALQRGAAVVEISLAPSSHGEDIP